MTVYCDRCGEVSTSPDNEAFGSFLCEGCYGEAMKRFEEFMNELEWTKEK